MTRYARVGESRKRPLDATQWKDMKKKNMKKPKKGSQSQEKGRETADKNATTEVKPSLQSTEKQETDCKQPQNHDTSKTEKTSLPLDRNLPAAETECVADTNEKQVKSHDDETGVDNKFAKKQSDKKQKNGDRKSRMECYNCHKKGHKVADCPEPSDGKMDNVQCYKCKQKGHKSFKCPNADKFPDKKQKFENPSSDFGSFQKDFKHQWGQKTGLKKALIEAWKAQEKGSGKTFSQFKKEFQKSWSKKTGFNKALRDEWKKHGKDLKQELRKQERSEQRRLNRQDKRETEKHCFNCRGSGHQLSECPELKKDLDQGTGICFKCGSTEHAMNKCTVKVPDGQLPYAKCFICGETGHISKQCPDNPRGLYPNGGCCKVCESVEHLKKDCPELQKKQGIGSITLTVMDSNKSGDWEDIKQRRPFNKAMGTIAPATHKVVKF